MEEYNNVPSPPPNTDENDTLFKKAVEKRLTDLERRLYFLEEMVQVQKRD